MPPRSRPKQPSLKEFFVPMADAAVRLGLSPTASAILVRHLVRLCEADRQGCLRQLAREGARKIVLRRFLLQPLVYLAVVSARLPLAALLMAKDETIWARRLVAALGLGAVAKLMIASYRHHVELARRDRRHAYLLVRMSPRWRSHPAVRTHLQELERRITTGKATRTERRVWARLREPVGASTPLRTGRPGRPPAPKLMFAAERREELLRASRQQPRRYLHQLCDEVAILFEYRDVTVSLRRELRRFMRTSPVWVAVPASFDDTPIGKCLAPLVPPPIGDSPYVKAKLVARSRSPAAPTSPDPA